MCLKLNSEQLSSFNHANFDKSSGKFFPIVSIIVSSCCLRKSKEKKELAPKETMADYPDLNVSNQCVCQRWWGWLSLALSATSRDPHVSLYAIAFELQALMKWHNNSHEKCPWAEWLREQCEAHWTLTWSMPRAGQPGTRNISPDDDFWHLAKHRWTTSN